eukprot:3855967-Prymnesium_polylepis.1
MAAGRPALLPWWISLHSSHPFCLHRRAASRNRLCHRDADVADRDAGVLLIEAPAGVDWSLQSTPCCVTALQSALR